jgi:hypothetical protein
MPINSKQTSFDTALVMKDAGLVATSAAATVAGNARVIDLGAARVDGRVIIDATAIEVDSNNEKYDIELQVSNASNFGSGIFIAGKVTLGHSSTTNESASTAVGRRELAFTNEINGTVYRYARLFTRVAGTVSTGINYTAVLGTKG